MANGQYGPCVEHHRVQIYDRGGSRRLYTLTDVGSVEWTRERDAKSSSTVQLLGRSCEAQADVIQDICNGTGRYEMVLFRGQDRVWEGPIRSATTLRDRATFLSADVKEYIDHTALSKVWPGPDGGGPPLMGDRLREIIQYELSTDYTMTTGAGAVTVTAWENLNPPINVLPFMVVDPGTVLTRSETLDFEMLLGEHMDNLVDGGIDYTIVGRRLIMWDSALSIGQTRRLTDADFLGDIEVTRYGSEHWSISHLSATKEGDESERAVGHAGATDPFYGSWENIVSQQSEESTAAPTQDELNSQANRDVLHRNPAPIEVRVPDGVSIRLTDDLTVNMLIPGVLMPVVTDKNIQRVTQMQRLDKVTVTEDSSGETVSVTLSPFGDVSEVAI